MRTTHFSIRIADTASPDAGSAAHKLHQRDGRRQAVADLFAIWWEKHGDKPTAGDRTSELTVSTMINEARAATDALHESAEGFVVRKIQIKSGCC